MQAKMDRILKLVYKKWKSSQAKEPLSHPDEEELACFIEGKLSPQESQIIEGHLVACETCAQAFTLQARLRLDEDRLLPVPDKLIEACKNIIGKKDISLGLKIILRLREKALELLETSGDVLVGQEVVAAPVLRSRQIRDFKDEVTILKDFEDLRVEIKIENKRGRAFNLTVAVKEKQTSRIIKDLRVTLLKDDLELESYLSDSGKVVFEHVLVGKYEVQVSTAGEQNYQIMLDIRA